MTHFAFLQQEWPDIHEAAAKAEAAARPDPRTSCFHARRALELSVKWLYRADSTLKLPYDSNLAALIHEPTFKQLVGEDRFSKAKIVNQLGNRAVHENLRIPVEDSITAVGSLFHFLFWLGRTYARGERPAGVFWEPKNLPAFTIPKEALAILQRRYQEQFDARDEELKELRAQLATKAELDDELVRLRAEVEAAKAAAAAIPDTHDYSEAETRDYFIDLLLKEAGWPLNRPADREYQVTGMPAGKGDGRVDYVLWGDDGRPLGLVEAKRTRKDARIGQQQAKLYADCLEQEFGQRPVIFYSNGYSHHIWDDTNYPPREVQGFYKKAELELMIQRRTSRKPLATAEINPAIVERYYQTRAIRRIGEAFEQDHDRKALVVMATGAGKTRTVIALCDLLMRCNWAKRVLFLADRVALVKQAANAFTRHLPDSAPVNLVTDNYGEGRVYVSTYPSMMSLIEESREGQRRFGAGHFDLIIIDEAHRSVFQKYRAIFSYFDSLLVGLTATPKDEVDRNTYELFDLENGVPTDVYSLDQAVGDAFLVPPRAVSVPLRFQQEGIRYGDLSEEERDDWDALEWDEDGAVPDRIEAEAVNKWLFNTDTVDKVLAHLMTHGQTVAGGDRLGKTIIFAKNQAHAQFIADRFDWNYPHLKGQFARVITHSVSNAQSLIDDFSVESKAPHIAISVDMLDTGIDVPEVVNLVFFKLVRSKTKFWQMVGRGTRLRPDLFGPGEHKEFFYIFDYCQNLEFFSQDLPETGGSVAPSIGKRLFTTRLQLLTTLDERFRAEATDSGLAETRAVYGDPSNEREVRETISEALKDEVAAMNVENFVVRPHRDLVERYSDPAAWVELPTEAVAALSERVAGLPSARESESEEAKRFDLIMLNLQLALLQADPKFTKLRDRVREIASLLEDKAAIPMVNQEMALIEDIQSDEWWQDVTLPMLERARRRLRGLVQFIEKRQRKPIYTHFEDLMGDESPVHLPGFGTAGDFAKFRAKARAFLLQHENDIAIHKLRMNLPLTQSDLEELERMLLDNGVGGAEDIERAREVSPGLGIFLRSLVGLDRSAAKDALAGFLTGKTLTGNQIEFVNLVVEHLTEHGIMEGRALYESPFTDRAPGGPDSIFTSAQVDELFDVLAKVRATASAA